MNERRVPVWLVVLVALALIPASTLAMTVGALFGSSLNSQGTGAVSCARISPGRYQDFFASVLQGIQAPVSAAQVTALAAWHQAEGGSASWNPLNTTQPAPGATDYNSVGVKNYPSEVAGVHATIVTLLNGNYAAILTALRTIDLNITALAAAVDGSVWGTKHMSDVVAGCTAVTAGFTGACPHLGRGTPWGGYANGAIPEQGPAMVRLPAGMHGQWLRCDAATSLVAMSAQFKQRFGHDIYVTDGYRDLAEQRDLYATKPPGVAARPGTSNHGWGCAVDLGGGIQAYGSAPFTWMKRHASRFGWVHPAWAESHPFEPWHWEYQACTRARAAT